MLSAKDTKHLSVDAETPRKSFTYIASNIPQEAPTGDPDASCTDKDLASTLQPIEGIADFFKNVFDGRLKCSIMEANKSTWSIKYNKEDFANYADYQKQFPDRDKRRVNTADWLKHVNDEHVVIARSGKRTARHFALDIDQKNILETELAFQLLQIEQETGLKLYYCKSTSGRAWHIWGFSKQARPVAELRTLARFTEKHLSFKIDLVFPCGGLGITAPFAKSRPLFDTKGIEQTPDSIEFNNVSSIIKKLPVIELPTEQQNVLEHNTATQKSVPKSQNTFIPHSMPDLPIPKEVGEALAVIRDKELFINKFFEVYPLQEGFRHWLCLLVSADLIKRFGCSLEETLQIIKQAATSKNDEEIEDRLTTVKSTHKRFLLGQSIISTRMFLSSKSFQTCFFTKVTSLNIPRSELQSIVLGRSITALYENGFFDGGQDDWKRISKRLLSSIAGIGDKAAHEALKELSKRGILKSVKTGKKRPPITS